MTKKRSRSSTNNSLNPAVDGIVTKEYDPRSEELT